MQQDGFRDLGRCLCVITGASRGLGRALALQMSSAIRPGSVLLLVARSTAQLNQTRREICTALEGSQLLSVDGGQLDVRCVQADLEKSEGLEKTLQAARETPHTHIQHLIIINNAGSLGDISRPARSFTDPSEISRYLSLNVCGPLSLTAGLLQAFPCRSGLRRSVINISSLCALSPFPSWVLYCTGKAARDMMFRVLAQEEPELRVLSYAPGPLDTEMQQQARCLSADASLRRSFTHMFASGQLLSCHESARKLIKLLLDDDFPSGAHLDFYEL